MNITLLLLMITFVVIVFFIGHFRKYILEWYYLNKLNSNQDSEWQHAAIKLGIMKSKRSIPRLIELLQEKSKKPEKSGITSSNIISAALAEIGEPAVPFLINELKSQNITVRCSAAWSLGSIGSDAKEAVPSLIELLYNRDVRARFVAASALGQIGTEAKEAIPDLRLTLQDKEISVRDAAQESLKNIQRE